MMNTDKKSVLSLSEEAGLTVDSSILITGFARSGTTVIGKVIHSFSEMEYCFEPPLLFTLFPLMKNIDKASWKLIFSTALYEDYYINALAGRSINCNIADDSSVYHVKDSSEIERRLSFSLGKTELEKRASLGQLSYKLPDIAPFLPNFQAYYNKVRIVVCIRNVNDVANSLIKKSWFSDDSLINTTRIWPFSRRDISPVKIPFWVDECAELWWLKASEIERVYYYCFTMRKYLSMIKSIEIIDYDRLVENPLGVVNKLSESLGCEFGSKTMDIIKTIERKSKCNEMICNKNVSDSIQRSLIEEGLL